MIIRPETHDDKAAIARVNREAFSGDDEAELIDRLRDANLVASSLVAENEGKILGHILLSWLEAEIAERPLKALALAPMAVTPARQRHGIGSRLVEASIDVARGLDAEIIFVLGHPAFYRRFGFDAQIAAKFENPFKTEAFMALPLLACVSGKMHGTVRYPAAFCP